MPYLRSQEIIASLHERQADVFHADFKGLSLTSHFQPIFSLSHNRVVGHEGLLRGQDDQGRPVPPLTIFNACADEKESAWCDALSRALHVRNFAAHGQSGQWLFLNVRPEALLSMSVPETRNHLLQVLEQLKIPANLVVLELLESAIPAGNAFREAVEIVREQGVLIALDDFGAGHSNFDRVWALRPDIVKLDRSLITGLSSGTGRHRVVTQMVSLLHESRALVLAEGIETEEEALLALESDVDLVQGYFFCRPQARLLQCERAQSILDLHGQLARFRAEQKSRQRAYVAPYQNAIGHAGVMLSAGRSMEQACQSFMTLPGAELCFVLDEHGFQVGPNIWSQPDMQGRAQEYGPLAQTDGACWARRPYFKRALQAPGKVHVTRPYRSMHGGGMTITVSYAYLSQLGDQPQWRVICGDVSYEASRGQG